MDINAYCLPFWSSVPPLCEENGGGAGDICFKDSLQPYYWRECTWLPLSNPCNQWLPGLSLSLAHFIFYILVFHLCEARGNEIEWVGAGWRWGEFWVACKQGNLCFRNQGSGINQQCRSSSSVRTQTAPLNPNHSATEINLKEENNPRARQMTSTCWVVDLVLSGSLIVPPCPYSWLQFCTYPLTAGFRIEKEKKQRNLPAVIPHKHPHFKTAVSQSASWAVRWRWAWVISVPSSGM